MMDRRWWGLVGIALSCACATTTTQGSPSDRPADPSAEADRDRVTKSGAALEAVFAAIVAADSAFDFDPTIDPAASASANAGNIARQSALATCAHVTTSGDNVAIDYGASCLVRAETLSGKLGVGVTKEKSTTTLTLAYGGVAADGKGVSGTATFRTTDGASFDVSLQLGGISGDIKVSGAAGAFRIDGTFAVVEGGATLTVHVDGVRYLRGHCYATEGAVTAAYANDTTTYAFEPVTPFDGKVAVTRNGVPRDSVALPAYGSCGVP